MRILIVMHMHWRRELGAPRVSIELSEEFERLGHRVEKYALEDAFPNPSRIGSFFSFARFPAKAVKYVKAHAGHYDVILAEQGNLPVTKAAMGFTGVLVARSNGLAHFYERFEQQTVQRLKRQGTRRGSVLGNLLRAYAKRMEGGLDGVNASFRNADFVTLLNEDEMAYAAGLGFGGKCRLFHNGLSDDRFAAFAAESSTPAQRLAEQRVVFIGSWGSRKGAEDWPTIVAVLRQRRPNVRFLFLGTGMSAHAVLSAFPQSDRNVIEVIPDYRSEDLPRLLSTSSVSFLPSYIEGFGIGVLEALAAGIPTVAYDVPGPREMLKRFDRPMMVQAGDSSSAVEVLNDLLSLPAHEFQRLSASSREIASGFRWKDIARQMLELYQAKLSELRGKG